MATARKTEMFVGDDMPEDEETYVLQASESLLAAREFDRRYGKLPLEVGVLCWDFMKNKTGIIQVGFRCCMYFLLSLLARFLFMFLVSLLLFWLALLVRFLFMFLFSLLLLCLALLARFLFMFLFSL